MKNVLWESAQRVFKPVLDWFQSTKDDSIKERYKDIFEDGVSENELNNMEILGKDIAVSLSDFLHIKIDTGIAYKLGERIVIDNSTITYDATNPSDTTDNGLGTLVPTPHSTGSFDIPLTGNVFNYVYIAYLKTTDETEFSMHKLTNAKLFYKQTDGYEITVNTTGINPDVARFILLGEIDLTVTNQAIVSTISTVNRNISRSKVTKIGIETNNLTKTDRPASYAIGNEKHSLNDHIKSVGEGLVSPTNPHGLDISDLGVSPNQTVEIHRKLEHSNAIIGGTAGDPFPLGSALYALKIDTLIDFMTVKALSPTEVVSINGVAYNSSVFPNDVNIYFTDDGTPTGVPLPSNTYQIIFDSTTFTILIVAGTAVPSNVNYLWLSTVSWDNATTSIIGTPTDRRKIGGTVNMLQRWTTGGRPNPAIPGHFGYNTDANKLEYYNGASWIQL